MPPMRCSRPSTILPTCWLPTTACPAWTAASSSKSCAAAPPPPTSRPSSSPPRPISTNAWPRRTVDDFVEKPFFLKEATRRIKRVIDKIALEKMTKAAPSDGVLRGSLAQMNVIDLMQSLEMGRKSCLLSLTRDDEKCGVYFKDGQVVHAVYGELKGDPAVFKVLRWTGGNFQLDFEGKTTESSTQLNTQGLLMEGLRLLDESNRDAGERDKAEEEDVLLDT